MKRYYIFFLLMFFGMHLYSQESKPITNSIETAKQNGETFKEIKDFLVLKNNFPSPTDIADATKVSFFDYSYTDFQRQTTATDEKSMSFKLPLNGVDVVTIDLLEVPVTFYEYVVKTSNGEELQPSATAKHYRGTIREFATTSIVAMSFFENEIMGILSIEGMGTYNVGKLKNNETHIIYKDSNVTKSNDFHCATPDDAVHYRMKLLN